MIPPLSDSKIKIEYNQSGQQEIVIPQPSGGVYRFFVGAFLIFWLCGWADGWKSAFEELMKGNKDPEPFLIFWLCGWTVGGFFALYFLYKMFRSPVPEKVILAYPGLIYDSGVPPFQLMNYNSSQKDFWKGMFRKRVRTEFDREQLKTLKLRELDSGNRLTIDQGNNRIEIASGASEPEREWLFRVINEQYNSGWNKGA